MHIGAMVDIGVPVDWLRARLAELPVAHEFDLEVVEDKRRGIRGQRASVRLADSVAMPHRHLADVSAIIAEAAFPATVTARALDIFERLARAEAHVHGTSVEAIHFHEVGATDAIVDICAAALALDYLGIERAACTVVELGGGMVRCAHGLMPVPAPATAALVTGLPCHYGRVDKEATTPTGAAILASVVDRKGVPADFVSARIGYGLGQMDFAIPNALRVMLGDSGVEQDFGLDQETNVEIEANIDDMSAEAFGPLVDALLSAGARDVFLTPIVMKKGRPATRVSVLAAPADGDRLTALLLTESSTIGVRRHQVDKHMLRRTARTVVTSVGELRVKVVVRPDGRIDAKAEHDDIVRLARDGGRSYLEVRRQVEAELPHLVTGPER